MASRQEKRLGRWCLRGSGELFPHRPGFRQGRIGHRRIVHVEARPRRLRDRLDLVERSSRLILLGSLVFTLAACISYETSDARSRIQNPQGNTLFAEILPGQTTSDWLRQRLGAPARITEQGEGESLWRYDNVIVTDRTLKVLPLFEVSHTQNHQYYFYFEIENNLIVDYWTTHPQG